MKKFFISADIEGCGPVSSEHAMAPDRWEWKQARQWMTEDVIAASEAAFEAGYDEVVVADSHGNAHNIDPDALPDNVRLIRSWPRPLMMVEGVDDPDVNACAFLGYHAHAHTAGSVLAHNFSGAACRTAWLNGEICSEGYFNAAVAGEFRRPVVFVSGDAATIADAKRYAPDAVGFVAKHSIGRRSQSSLPPRQVRARLKDQLAAALAKPLPAPFVVKGPYRLELEMTTLLAAEMLAYLPHFERTQPFQVAGTFASLAEAMRVLTFTMFYSPTGTGY